MSVAGYMFDTMIFNRILDEEFELESLRDTPRIFATHVQFDELYATPDPKRRGELLCVFTRCTSDNVPTEGFALDVSRLDQARLGGAKVAPTESGAWDVSAWDEAKWGNEGGAYTTIKRELDARNNSRPNNVQDALIAETALKNGWKLVTEDTHLREVVRALGGKCLNIKQFKEECGGDGST